MKPDCLTPAHAHVSERDLAELDRIREQFRALSTQKLGLAGNRAFMDQGHEHADFPDLCQYTTLDIGGVSVEKVVVGNAPATKALLHCHGGGYTVGSILSHRPLAARLAEATGYAVYTFNYRLAPEHPFPAALEDASTVYRHLLEQYTPDNLAVSGDSAGGSLVFALLLAVRDMQLPQPHGAIGLSPWLDLACEGNTFQMNKAHDPAGNRGGLLMMAHAYAGKANLKLPLVSPLYAETFSNLCPMLLQVGTAETLLDDSRRFAEKAARDGVSVTLEEWPHMIHVWHSFYGRLPQADAALRSIGRWLSTHA
jgi:monoterpene epsilon-lactone hydrolase